MATERTRTLDSIKSLLVRADKIVLTTHVTPDGDGLGSALALMRYLRSEGKDARLINCSSTPQNLRFLIRPGEFSVWRARKHQSFLSQADVIVATDIGGASRLGKMERPVREASGRKVVIDHHIYENDIFDEALIDTAVCSSAEITYDLIRHMGGEIDQDIAEPLYVGIVSDTGSFSYTATNSRAHRIAAEFLETGVNPHHIWRKLACEASWQKMKVLGICLATITSELDGRVVWTSVDLKLLNEQDTPARDAFEVVNHFLKIKDVEVGVFFMEISSSRTKVSLRSAGRADVCTIAARHGGGGHRFAAGCTVEGHDLEQARRLILGEVAELVQGITEEQECGPASM